MTTIADDVWIILRELAKSQKETDRKFQETDLKFKETDRKFQETSIQFQETDRKIQESSIQFLETDRKIKEVTKNIGKLGNRLGEFIEDALRPAVVRLFQQRGIDVHEVHQNITASRDNEGLEIDLLVVNNSEIVAVECKSNLSIDDINAHLERLTKLKRLLPAYADKRVLGAVASMVIADNVAQYAFRKGLYVIGQSGEHLQIRNAEDFTAKSW